MRKLIFFLPILFLSFLLVNDDYFQTWKNDPAFVPATIGFAVYDLDSNQFILEHNKSKVLPAASTQKLISTSIALKVLGSDHTFSSSITHNGTIQPQLLKGDICIFPNKNPALGNKRFGQSVDDIVLIIDNFLKENKITAIGGGIEIVDPTYEKETLPRTWIWEDIGNYYGANPTGTILNENIVELYFNSGAVGEPTKIVKTKPDLPYLKFNNRVLSSKVNKDMAYVFSGPNSKVLTIEGTIPANRKSFKVKASLTNPQKALAYLVYKALKAKGYKINGKYKVRQVAKKQTKLIAKVTSPSVAALVEVTNQKSINIFSENLLENSYDFTGSQLNKMDWTKDYLEKKMKVNTTGMILKDGCGLSRYNAISPEQLVQILSKMKNVQLFRNSLPIAGESGTLKNFMLDSWAKGQLRAKSGYMQGVRSYAGYVTSKSGKKLAFAIIVNNANCSAGQTKKKIGKLLNHISNL